MTAVRRVLGTWFALFAFVLAAVAAAPAATPPPYVITAILSLTGPYAFVGSADAAALKVFEDYTNKHGGIRGRPLHFAVEDDQSQPSVAVQLSTQLVATHPAVMMGSNGGSLCNAMMPIYKDGPLMFCVVPSIYPPKGGYVFATQVALNPFVNGMVRYMRLRGWKNFAVISSTDGSGQVDDIATKDVLNNAENKEMKVVDWEHFNPSDLNVNAQAARIKSSGAQAVLVWTAGTPFGTVLRSLNDAGAAIPVVTSNANMHANQLAQYTAFYPPELVMPGLPYFVPASAPAKISPSPAMRKAFADFFAAYQGSKPDPGSAPFVWDAASMIVNGLRKLGPDASAADLRTYLLGLRGFVGIDGVYDYASGDQHGLSDQSVVLSSWDQKSGDFYAMSGMGGVPLPVIVRP